MCAEAESKEVFPCSQANQDCMRHRCFSPNSSAGTGSLPHVRGLLADNEGVGSTNCILAYRKCILTKRCKN